MGNPKDQQDGISKCGFPSEVRSFWGGSVSLDLLVRGPGHQRSLRFGEL